MPKNYLVRQSCYARDYYDILHMIDLADTEIEFRNIQQRLNDFHRNYRYKVRGWWVFSYIVEDKQAYGAWCSLQNYLTHRIGEVYSGQHVVLNF